MSLTTSLIDASDLQGGLVFAGTSADIPGVLSDAPVDWKSDPSLRWRLLYVEGNSNLDREQSSVFREASNLRGPVFDLGPFSVNGRPQDGGAALWALDHQGRLAMTADAEFDAGS